VNPTDAALIFGALGVVLLGGTLLLFLEAYLLIERRPPITAYTRNAIMTYPGLVLSVAGVFLLVVGLLSGHFIWDAGCR
jgi:hypothetical protein